MPGGEEINGRVTNRQLYEALMQQNQERVELERRLMEKWNGVPTQVQNNKEEIANLRKRSDFIDVIEAIVAGVAIFFGSRQQ